MDRFAVGYSDINNSKTAFSIVCEQLCTGMGRREPILIVFSSDCENFEYYSKQMRRRFPFSTVIGMTAYMGFSSRGYGKNALSCIAIMEGIEIKAGKVKNPENGFDDFSKKAIETMGTLKETDNTLCFGFGANILNKESMLDLYYKMEAVGVKYCGGSIGESDEGRTMMSLNGDVFSNGGIFCFIHNLCGRIELLMHTMTPDGIENAWDTTANTVKDWGFKPGFSIVSNGIDYTRMMENKNLLYRFTDKLCMEFGQYIGFSGYEDSEIFEEGFESMAIAVFE